MGHRERLCDWRQGLLLHWMWFYRLYLRQAAPEKDTSSSTRHRLALAPLRELRCRITTTPPAKPTVTWGTVYFRLLISTICPFVYRVGGYFSFLPISREKRHP